MSGKKFDNGKPRMSLLAMRFVWGVVGVLEYGAGKYAENNWRAGMKWSRPFNAAMRHLWAWWGGEKIDPETGLSHLYHASCNLMFLSEYEATGIGEDDRQWRPDVNGVKKIDEVAWSPAAVSLLRREG